MGIVNIQMESPLSSSARHGTRTGEGLAQLFLF